MIRTLARAAALALLAASAALAASDEEIRAFLHAWAERMRDVRTLRVEFTQEKRLKILRRPLVSRGFAVLKGKRLRLVVLGEDGAPETELAVDEGRARVLFPRLQRLEVYRLEAGRKPPPAPFPLFGGEIEALPDTYRVDLAGDTLILVPRDPAADTAEIRMTFGPEKTITEVRQTSRRGDTVRLEISKFEVNAAVEDAEVEMRVPEGTEVVDDPGNQK